MAPGRDELPMYASSNSTPRLRSPHSIDHPFAIQHQPSRRSEFPISTSRYRPNASKYRCFLFTPRKLRSLLKVLVPAILLGLFIGLYLYEPHIELAFYSRSWVHREIETITPLSGCFDPSRVSEKYNATDAIFGQRRTEVQAGLPLRMGLDCYDFAGTIQTQGRRSSSPLPAEERIQFHTYWRTDLAPFGPRQEWMLKSFFATQDVSSSSRLVLWSNGDLGSNEILRSYLRRYPDAFALRIVDIPSLAKGTELEGSGLLTSKDTKAWVDGDLVRLLLLWTYGGVWVDMDSLLTRDLEPLLEHEFVTQWDCYGEYTTVINSCSDSNVSLDKKYQPFNGALMRFRQYSPYLCEAFHIMATSSPPRSGSTDWGSLLYFKLWRRLVAASIPPFKVLPFCFSDGRSCRLDNRLPDPFVPDNSAGKWTMGLGLEEGGGLDNVLNKKIFGVHLHNQWEKAFPSGGWVERLLLKKYENKLGKKNTEDEL